MRRSGIAGVAIVVSLTLGGVPALAQDDGWRHRTDRQSLVAAVGGQSDVYYTIHPDGTLVALTGSAHDTSGTVGLGVWRPTGDHSLAASWVYGDADRPPTGPPGPAPTAPSGWSMFWPRRRR